MSSAEDGTVVPREETDIPPPPRRDETNDSEDVPPPPPRRETTDDASPPPPTTEQEVAPTAAATTDDSKGLAPVQDTLPPADPSEIELATSTTMSKVADVELGAEELELLMDIGDEAAENNNGGDASSTSSASSSSSDDDNVDDADGNVKEDPAAMTVADTSENKDGVEDEDSGEKKRKRDEADGNGDHDDDDVLSKKKEKKEKKDKKDKKSKKEKKDKKSKKEKKDKKSKKDKKEKKDKKAETEEGESSDPKPAKKPAAPRKPKEPPVDSVTRFQQGASTNDILADARKQLAKKNAKVRQQEREAAAVDPGRKAFKESQRQCRKQIDHQRISEDLQRSLTSATYGGVALSGGGGGEMSNSMPVPGILARLGSTATMGSGGSPDQSQHLPPPPLSINTGASATSGLAGPSPTSTPTTISRLAASFSNPVPMVGGFAAPSAPSSQHMAGLTSSQNMPSSATASPRDATDLTNRFLARFTHEKSKKIQQIVNKPSSGLAAALAGSNGKSKGSAAAAKVQNDEEEHVELEIEVGGDESGNSPEEEQANMFPASFGQNKNTQDELKKKRVRLEIGDSQSTGADDSQHNVIDLGAIENDNEGSGDDEHTRNIRRRHEMKRLQKAYAAEASQSQSVFGASAANSQAGGGGVSSVAAAVSRHNASQSSGGGSGHHHHGHHHHGSEGSRKVFLGTTTTTPGTTSSVASAPSAAGAASAPAAANNADVVLQSLKRTSVLSRKASTAFTSVSAADATMLRRTNSFENAGGGGLMVFGSNKQGSDNTNSQTK